MEPFNNELPDCSSFPTITSAFSEQMEVEPASGVGDAGDQSNKMPPPAFAGGLSPQAAHSLAFGHHAGFEYSGLHVAEPDFQLSPTFTSGLPPWDEDSYQPVEQDPFFGATISLSPFLSPSQDQLGFLEPRIPNDISSPTVDMFSVPPSQNVLPAESQDVSVPAPAFATTTGRTRSLGAGAEWSRHKDTIRQLYIEENRSLKITMEIMKEEHGFVSE